jgi:hypothetical protein
MKVAIGDGPGHSPTRIASGPTDAKLLSVDATSVYWTAGNRLLKVLVAGGTPTVVAKGAYYLGVDATSFYSTDSQGTLKRTPLGGGPAMTIAPGECWSASYNKGRRCRGPSSIAIDATRVYWTTSGNREDGPPARVSMARLDGGTIATLAVLGPVEATGIAVDTDGVYWISEGKVMKLERK